MKAVVLAGGKGTRLAPYSRVLPKPLMPIGDMPILEVLLRQLKNAGVDEVVLTVGYLAGLLQAFFQDGKRLGIRLSYSIENRPLGTVGPLSLVEGLQETFLVTNGDVLTTLDFARLLRFHCKQKAVLTIASHRRKVSIDYGVLQLDSNHCLIGYTEKPTFDYLVSMGVYIFEPGALDYIPYNQYLDFPDLVKRLIAAGERVVSFPYEGYWMDLGRPDDYERASRDFDKMRTRFLPEESRS